ncbi:hypothetical protein K450DRAFT_239103 [Umbelopsis ramanniana AG]|uniref:Cora-domain-containing protein n=1 Tax=Umbelopsis ramanniana AG TaxID=1314678 RepID=A0AAD5EAS0_UMBRA|nr:uncharacterized protein K450DRAFT_239103 [Umbelopsis ramanniana AG]KAI8580044.1 hypothetical protein K450DRAFT_239103 [Umbelopsis ramanniana AG]
MTKSRKRGNRTSRPPAVPNRDQYQRLDQPNGTEDSQNSARSTLGRIFGRTPSADSPSQERNVYFSSRPQDGNYSPRQLSPLSPNTGSEQPPTDLLIDIGPPPSNTIANYLNDDPYNSDIDTTSRHTSVAEEDVCFPQPDIEKHQGETDYNALEEFLDEEGAVLFSSPITDRSNRKSSRNVFTASPTETSPQGDNDIRKRHRRLSTVGERRFSMYGDRDKHLDVDQQDNSYRVTFYSPHLSATIHARTISEIPSNGETLVSMMKKGQYWIDILNPTDMEMKALSKIFHIHPLTTEDITMEESREKCEVFKNYIFVCFRSFDADQYSVNYLQPIGLYIIMTREAILTFHYRPMMHPHNVRKRIKQLKDYINVTPDWIMYALLDDITDTFAPLIRAIEFEVDSIDELVLILKESEQSDMLRRIGYCRKRMMGLLRLLVSKADVVKTILKRSESRNTDGLGPALCPEVVLYLGDVQDHIITMLQSLNHYEKISSRSHSNYLAQISIEMTQTNNEINDILSKLTALGSILVPMNLVTGLWGMNVQVPGQNEEGLTWFFSIMGGILTFCIASTIVMRAYNII